MLLTYKIFPSIYTRVCSVREHMQNVKTFLHAKTEKITTETYPNTYWRSG